jgi:hypothetical protein
LVKDFLAKYDVTTLEHPHYSPGLAAADFYVSGFFQHLYRRWQKCIVAKEYYFEGNVA